MLPEQAAVMSALEAPRYALLVRIETTEQVFWLWTGVGDYATAPGDELDPEGATFTGIGIVGEVPALRQLIGGTAERVTFSLDGLTDALLSLADEGAATVKGAAVNVGIVFFDGEWQDVAPVAWPWCGTADVPSVQKDGLIRGVSLSVGSALFLDRTRAVFTYLTDQDQRRRSATDRFCERTAIYNIESTIKFPS
ncbi:MAG: hypothetical protein ACK4FB_08190 [Brevundimonas sp.]|uniref:hypothetical protein n=1 Tax=Brevundimonas sp. TaxID=1871086 RepID=UPI00391C0023